MKIIIPGEVICKKNHQMPIRMGKRTIIIPGPKFKEYEKSSVSELKRYHKWFGAYPVIVETYFYRKTLRKFDFDNMQATVNDVLVKAGILEDDSMLHVIPAIKGHGWEKDKEHPRVEITIKEIQ